MTIRKSKKDYLKEHAQRDGLTLLVSPQPPQPVHGADGLEDPLVFWTNHPEKPTKVDLNEFATGKSEINIRSNEKLFTGRPGLIEQLMPAIQASLVVATPLTVATFKAALRIWWAVLDEAESRAAKSGATVDRVDDVSKLGITHAEVAKGMVTHAQQFTKFRGLVDVTRRALGQMPTYWVAPEDQPPEEKHLPPEDQRKSFRIAIKESCQKVIDRWKQIQRIEQQAVEPDDPQEASLWRALKHFRAVQERLNEVVPDWEMLSPDGRPNTLSRQFGLTTTELSALVFPDKVQALAVFSQCMSATGWNCAVMLGLDISTPFLITNPKSYQDKSNSNFVLIGVKDRAAGQEQYAFGQWKDESAPGYLIRSYLERVEPLRQVLKEQLKQVIQDIQAQAEHQGAEQSALSSAQREELFKRELWLQSAIKSVWIYRDAYGRVNALDEDFVIDRRRVDGRRNGVTYLDRVLEDLNRQRALDTPPEPPIPGVTYRDFRDWFGHFVYEETLNIFAVQAALGQKSVKTTQGYLNSRVLNQEAREAAVAFSEILTDAMDSGHIDLTAMALQMRKGELTPEDEAKLAELRKLPRSRQGIGCRNPASPPKHISVTKGKACDQQRCLLCPTHAVLFDESLDGIAMREVELIAMRHLLPINSFVDGLYDRELDNHRRALSGFDAQKVAAARKKWSSAILEGRHVVPGIPLTQTMQLDPNFASEITS